MPCAFCAGLILMERGSHGSQKNSDRICVVIGAPKTGSTRLHGHAWIPVFLGERLLPHRHVLLFIHQSEQRGTRFDPQTIVVVLRVPSGNTQRKKNILKTRAQFVCVFVCVSTWSLVSVCAAP